MLIKVIKNAPKLALYLHPLLPCAPERNPFNSWSSRLSSACSQPHRKAGQGRVGGGEGSQQHPFCKGGNTNGFYCSLAADTFSQEALAGSSPWEGTRWHQSQRIWELGCRLTLLCIPQERGKCPQKQAKRASGCEKTNFCLVFLTQLLWSDPVHAASIHPKAGKRALGRAKRIQSSGWNTENKLSSCDFEVINH